MAINFIKTRFLSEPYFCLPASHKTSVFMFRFQHSDYLWFLLLIPFCIVLYVSYLQWRKLKVRKIGDPKLVQELIKGRIKGRSTTKFSLLAASILITIFALANLQTGAQTEKVSRKGVDVFFVLDVSKSMLATDVPPNRLTRAKQLINRMTDKMSNDRVGLVLFAGKSYLQVPLTVDYGAAKMLLSSVQPDIIPTQGTVVADAIEMARQSFSSTDKKYKAIVLISDGEDHDERALEQAKKAAEEGVVIYTIGIGSPEGSTLIDPETGSIKMDQQGQPVVTRLNEAELQSIAEATGGTYKLLTNTNRVADGLTALLDNMEGRSLGSVLYNSYNSYFQYFLVAALLLLVADLLIPFAAKISPSRRHNNKV